MRRISKSRRRASALQRAFTLVEVLMTVTILGIAGLIVVPQMLQASSMQIQGAARIVIADLIVAQNEAIAHQATRRVVFEPATNRYWLTDGSGALLDAPWKGSGEYRVNFSRDTRFRGVSLNSADFDGSAVIAFDELGAPSAGGVVELIAAETAYEIEVAAFTGRVSIRRTAGS